MQCQVWRGGVEPGDQWEAEEKGEATEAPRVQLCEPQRSGEFMISLTPCIVHRI